jgi:acetyltransferase-like isoleucine patch superfamily enzyme
MFESLMYATNHWVNNVPVYAMRNMFYRKFLRLEIGEGTAIQMGILLTTRGGVQIGDNSVINRGCTLDGRGKLFVGNNVNISQEVMILTAEHDVNHPFFAGIEAPVVIHDDAWISTRSMLLPGVTVGRGAVVAAGAVVTKDIPAYSIVAGVPARVIGKRSNNLKYELSYFRLFQ